MCCLEPLPHRLRYGETRGVGPWEDSYFKRQATLEELRQDFAELQRRCEAMRRAAQERAEEYRRIQLQTLAGQPIPEVDELLIRVGHDPNARDRILQILEGLGADDPRRARYRKELARRLF